MKKTSYILLKNALSGIKKSEREYLDAVNCGAPKEKCTLLFECYEYSMAAAGCVIEKVLKEEKPTID